MTAITLGCPLLTSGRILQSATGCITGAVIDCCKACSATPYRPCHILKQLADWNELLFHARMQLREMPGSSGKLAMVNIDDSRLYMGEPHHFEVQKSASVMHHLLKHHRCVASLCIASFQFQRYVQPLRDALPYTRLKKLKMTCLASLMSDGLWVAIPSLTSLEELECSFFCCCSNYHSNELSSALATLVQTSPFLVVLCLTGISLEEQATKNLLASLTEKSVLRELTFGTRVIPDTCRKELARYLMLTPSLMSFSYTGDNEKTEIAVLEGVLHNRTLSKVTISTFTGHAPRLKRFNIRSHIDSYEYLSDVCHALEDSGVDHKVSCGDYLVEDNIDLLKCKMFSGLTFVDEREDLEATALRQLLDSDHLTSLVLQIPKGNLAMCSALAKYLQSTSVLRKLQLRTGRSNGQGFSQEWWHIIVRSLSRNKSIKKLAFFAHNMSDSDVESLVEAVDGSTSIRKLKVGDTSMTSLRAIVNRLSAHIAQNHTLLGVVLEGRLDQGWLDASRNVFTISEATRRNSDLLAAAAAFRKAIELDRRSTAALERIYKLHAVLLEDLAELVEVSAAEIRGNESRVMPRDDGSMQLDDLGEDCWSLIRRFLMLDDVEEVVPHTDNL
ncbi:hypothetical protein MRX96_048341 [Rhipicephalus microplus]